MKWFKRKEFACKCGCGFDTVDYELAAVLDATREHFGRPITVTSGARCVTHNASIGGRKSSQHLLGRAADIVVSGVSPTEVHKFLDTNYAHLALGLYENFVHLDSRGSAARW